MVSQEIYLMRIQDHTVLATDNSIYQMLPQAIMSMTLFASLDWPANRIIEITSKKNGFGCKPVLSRIR